MTRAPRWKLVATACGLVLLAGCASSSTSPGGTSSTATSPSASPSPSSSVLCADVAALRASLDQLVHVKVQVGVASEITADLANVEAALTKLVNDARGQWQAQTSALKAALDTLKTAVGSLTASPSASTASAVTAALGQVKTAAQDLLTAAGADCPSASPSSSA